MTNSDENGRSWALVLAAGDGTRLRELTTRNGIATPKQYCSLRGGRSLLGDALARAGRCVPRKRVVVVVAEEHSRFWERELADFPPENIVVQPGNRGTAAGILLPLMTVLERDDEARLAILPSDHFVALESVMAESLRLALGSLEENASGVTLLGITPDAPETGYGWIVPERTARLLAPVERFVEKPDAVRARELFATGALWNSFLFAAGADALLGLYRARLPDLLSEFQAAFGRPPGRTTRLAELYARLESSDFSRDVLQGSAASLRLAIVSPCGWTDLGTPERVAQCLALLREDGVVQVGARGRLSGTFDLALAVRSKRAAMMTA
jgi:mannose-1-phosphate guanylyltransferase